MSLSAFFAFPPGDDRADLIVRSAGTWQPADLSLTDDVRGLGAALIRYGLGEGTSAAVVGGEGRATLCAGLAVIASGATLVPVPASHSDAALRAALSGTSAAFAIASDESQLARILALRPDLPSLELVLLSSTAPSERKPAAMLVESAIAAGFAELERDPGMIQRAVSRSKGAACTLVDAPGGLRQISRDDMAAWANAITTDLSIARGRSVLCALPVVGAERLAVSLAALSRSASLQIADPADRPDAGLDERAPDAIVLDVPKLTVLHRAWMKDVDGRSWLGRRATAWALNQGGDPATGGWKRSVAEAVALRGLRGKLGGAAARVDVIGAAKGADLVESASFFSGIGVTVRFHDAIGWGSLAR